MLKEPDLTNWNDYDPEVVPKEKRRLILRITQDLGIPMYYIVVINNSKNGYCMTSLGSTYWSKFNRKGSHWAWLDELKVMKD